MSNARRTCIEAEKKKSKRKKFVRIFCHLNDFTFYPLFVIGSVCAFIFFSLQFVPEIFCVQKCCARATVAALVVRIRWAKCEWEKFRFSPCVCVCVFCFALSVRCSTELMCELNGIFFSAIVTVASDSEAGVSMVCFTSSWEFAGSRLRRWPIARFSKISILFFIRSCKCWMLLATTQHAHTHTDELGDCSMNRI